MNQRYCSKESYLQEATMVENGKIYHQVIAEEDLQAMRAAKHRICWDDRFSLHDCKITAVTQQGNDLIIDFDNSQGFTQYKQLVFQNGKITEQEYPLIGSFFIHQNLYYKDGYFTFYCLIWSPESQEPQGLGYLTFTATDIKLK